MMCRVGGFRAMPVLTVAYRFPEKEGSGSKFDSRKRFFLGFEFRPILCLAQCEVRTN
jgi:hypothetical protein